jgi:hypothetical protein
MNSLQTADAYPTTLAAQLLKLCTETSPGASRWRIARQLVKLFDDFEKDPENNTPPSSGVYYTDSCQWFKVPSR